LQIRDNPRMSKRKPWPKVIKGVVRIYKTPEGKYPGFTLVWFEGSERKRKKFADFTEGKKEAESIADKINHGENEALKLTNADRSTYVNCCDIVDRLGIHLETAVREYAEIRKILGKRNPLEAARYYVKTHPENMRGKLVSEVAAEFLAEKEKQKKSGDYLADCKYRHGAFAKSFGCDIADVTGDQINDFLDALKLSTRSRNNFRTSIGTLFEFAREKKYIPRDWDGMDTVKAIDGDDDGEITILTPGELKTFLSRARSKLVPFLAIGAMAGLRSAEIERLTWEDVFRIPGNIEVKAKKAKTRARRLVPIQPNLAKWLEVFKEKQGSVMPFADIGLQIREMCAKDGDLPQLAWKRNALRHSFISYRLADVKSAAQVALEAGNSETMVFKNYREIVTADAAKEWFSIEPVNR
jgi:integrase